MLVSILQSVKQTGKMKNRNPYGGAPSVEWQFLRGLKAGCGCPHLGAVCLGLSKQKRPWSKLLGHVFHIFGGKCSINCMFAWTPPAGRTQPSKGVERASHLQGEKSIPGRERKENYWSTGNSAQDQSARSFIWATF